MYKIVYNIYIVNEIQFTHYAALVFSSSDTIEECSEGRGIILLRQMRTSLYLSSALLNLLIRYNNALILLLDTLL